MGVPFSRFASQVLDNTNRKLNDALKEANGVIAVLGSRGRIKMVQGGGPNFVTRVLYGPNTNVEWRGKNAQIDTVDDEGITKASVPQRVLSGSMVINRVEKAQITGPWAIGNLLSDKQHQLETTYVQKWATSLLQDTPGAIEPYTLLPVATTGSVNGILQAAAGAAQAGTTAGIDRSANDWWRNTYFPTAIDISSEGGRASLYQDVYVPTVYGSSSQEQPDFGLTDSKTIGDLGAAADTNRRGNYQDQGTIKLGFENIVFFRAVLIRETSSQVANKVLFLNTRDLAIHVLREPGIEQFDQDNGLGSVPVVMDPFVKDIDSLNMVSLIHVVAGLVPSQLRTHALADNIT